MTAGDHLNYKLIICQLYDKVIEIKKEFFTSGIPANIYEVIMSIQAAFFLSHKIRKYVDLYLAFLDENLIIQYVGEKLRYLGPDERSIGMLLMKALAKKDQLSLNQKKQSTPGILVQHKSIQDFFSNFGENWHVVVVDNNSTTEIKALMQGNLMLIIPERDNKKKFVLHLSTQFPLMKLGTNDLPQKNRNYLTLLRFYSYYDKAGINSDLVI